MMKFSFSEEVSDWGAGANKVSVSVDVIDSPDRGEQFPLIISKGQGKQPFLLSKSGSIHQ